MGVWERKGAASQTGRYSGGSTMFVCVSERERERIFTFMNVTTVKKLKGLWIKTHAKALPTEKNYDQQKFRIKLTNKNFQLYRIKTCTNEKLTNKNKVGLLTWMT